MSSNGTGWATVDGNEAAARVAHALSEVAAIYPITPSSPMGELADAWSAAGRTNLWGAVPRVVQMQSEAGAAGVLHGAVLGGTLATTFTASQGLLLMLPDMFKIAGELTPAVMHVAARTVATHALSIFGDHSDVMAARTTGWAMLAAASVQEAHDLALVAHAATLRTRVPFLHFFDGFRTSHEINKIRVLTDADLLALFDADRLQAHRRRRLTPDAPMLRGSAQNPDVFFQAREAAGPFHDAVPSAVQQVMDELAGRTGRQYRLVEYTGAADAERVLVLMGSGAGAVAETVDELVRRGEKVGALTVRLYRPFPAAQLAAALPPTACRVLVLDRTKEPGSVGEPLYLDVVAALAEHGRRDVDVLGGRYGLSGKEFTPAMVKGVFDELASPAPRRRVTVGIVDDVTNTSITPDPGFRVPTRAVQAVLYGLGSDGTVGASKMSIKIIGGVPDRHAQGYFVYDSRKSGSTTAAHLRFGPDPIRSTYLVEQADLVGCHQFALLRRMPILDVARPGATFLLNSPYPADQVWDHMPDHVKAQILDKRLRCHVIDAHKVAREVGLRGRINMVLLPCFFALSGVLPVEQALAELKAAAETAYAKRGPEVVARNHAAIDRALSELAELELPTQAPAVTAPPVLDEDMFTRATRRILAGEGDLLPVSALPADGAFPTGTAKLEKRAIAEELPVWDPSLCTDCGKCTLVCPHAALRMKVYDPAVLAAAPDGFLAKDYKGREYAGQKLTVQVAPDDCTGCGICVEACPAVSRTDPTHKSINMCPAAEHRDGERPRWDFFAAIPETDRTAVRRNTVKGSQLLQPLFEFSGACSGCGQTPYLKLLTQLFGDRLTVANATGCSSIYGGNLPTTPWTTGPDGRGPAWANSLFEDNAEFGLGLRLSHEHHAGEARRLLTGLAGTVGAGLTAAILDAEQGDEAGIAAQRERIARLKNVLAGCADPDAARLTDLADELVRKTHWIVGGDGWAYDIGFGGLDHVLGSGHDVNILVMDTEVYSNTGGQASKATPRAAVAKYAASGKNTAKKDLAAIARTYPGVYVAQIAMGANEMQTVRALLEAEAHPGPSLVIAYATCIAHGIDMATSMDQQKRAVATGYWPLHRYRPGTDRPLTLDAKPPTEPLHHFTDGETRFTTPAGTDPGRARELHDAAQHDVQQRWQRLTADTERQP
ncbi:pyruvate:ferredoxin (flavodoxin) oxidoreductase [Actinoplanes sp. NPDC049802]|uniref:pyruvate:ferredoxin (flavodoxin) oxidoreductase n=1 Tax=Actinoplanes sp. NPDC049802 TaxID=3154742 RepID=UPI0033C3FC4D